MVDEVDLDVALVQLRHSVEQALAHTLPPRLRRSMGNGRRVGMAALLLLPVTLFLAIAIPTTSSPRDLEVSALPSDLSWIVAVADDESALPIGLTNAATTRQAAPSTGFAALVRESFPSNFTSLAYGASETWGFLVEAADLQTPDGGNVRVARGQLPEPVELARRGPYWRLSDGTEVLRQDGLYPELAAVSVARPTGLIISVAAWPSDDSPMTALLDLSQVQSVAFALAGVSDWRSDDPAKPVDMNWFVEQHSVSAPRLRLPDDQRVLWYDSWQRMADCMHDQGFPSYPSAPPTFGDGQTSPPLVQRTSGSGMEAGDTRADEASAVCAWDTSALDMEAFRQALTSVPSSRQRHQPSEPSVAVPTPEALAPQALEGGVQRSADEYRRRQESG